MVKFLCGLTLGVLGSMAFCYTDTPAKFNSILIGTFLGAALIVVTFIVFMQSMSNEIEQRNQEENKQKRRKEDWWKDGESPPWENDG
jgi:hypothetical protein